MGVLNGVIDFVCVAQEPEIEFVPLSQDYITMKDTGKGAVYLPHTAGRYAARRFRKAQVQIVNLL